MLAGILDAAVRDRRATQNVTRNLVLPKKRAKGKTHLTHEQVARLAKESQHSDFVLFLAYTGLRWGEATGLRVKHVDRIRRRVSVVENAVMVGGRIESARRRHMRRDRFHTPHSSCKLSMQQ